MPHFIQFLNFKGGTGKTTSVLNVGAALAGAGYRVCMVDMDAQHNLTQSCGVDEPQTTVYSSMVEKKPLVLSEIAPNLYLAANGLEMVKFEIEAAAMVRREYLLQQSLKPHAKDFDFFLFDCPPSLGLSTINALFASDNVAVFVPVEAEFLALKGFAVLNEALQNVEMEISRAFVTKYDKRKILARSVLDAMQTQFGDKLFKTLIRENVALAEAPAVGLDIFRHEPTSAGAYDYAELTKEILKYFGNE